MAHTKPFNFFFFLFFFFWEKSGVELVREIRKSCLNYQVGIPAFVIYDLNSSKNLFLR